MKTVLLTSGPRGAGKSTYAENLVRQHPEIPLISRDKILISLFGGVELATYEGEHAYAEQQMFGELKRHLSKDCPTQTILLDCWNGYSYSRRELIQKSKEYGADKVICLFFLISENLCVDWFSKKPDIGFFDPFFANSTRNNRKIFYHYARDIEEDGFDEIVTINSNQLALPFPSL